MDDQNGAINWLISQRRLQASASVRNGNATVNHEEIVGFIDQAIAALTPRHEAPAALCDHVHTDPMALCSDCEAASVEAPAEGAGGADVLVTMRDHYQFALTGPWPDIKTPNYALAGLFKMAGDEIERLRARSSAPEAREGYPSGAWGCVARLSDNTPWEAFAATEDQPDPAGAWSEAITLYTHPAAPSADKLREVLVDLTSWFTKPVQGQSGMVWVIPAGGMGADDALNAALAALKAGGA